MANCWRRGRKQPIRTLREFAEQEVVIPEGLHIGERFRVDTQPYVRLLYDSIDSCQWQRFACTGCVQSGKTLSTVVVPLLWHLFEHKETCIMGVPTMDVAWDKWSMEVLPAIQATPKFRELLPKFGAGSRGGSKFESVRFRHGPVLKFMSGKGGDEKRSAFTARVVVITEVDKMDVAKERSKEADPITQLEQRTSSFEDRARIYMECTVSNTNGRIWTEYTKGTMSKIVCRCPHCNRWIAPEREHFKGYKGCEDEITAEEKCAFHCPKCDKPIDDQQRHEMNLDARLLHGQQKIRGTNGAALVKGDLPRTYTLGFRWSAFHNLFWSQRFLAKREWRTYMAADEDNAEKEAMQFRWVLPYETPGLEETTLDETKLRRQVYSIHWTKGYVPESADWLCVGIDLGKWLGHWVLSAFLQDPPMVQVVDYGRFEIASGDLGTERAILVALREFYSDLSHRYGDIQQGWIDARYQSEKKKGGKPVYEFTSNYADNDVWKPSLGYAYSQQIDRIYNQPTQTGQVVKYIGDNFHITYAPSFGCFVAHVNADHWKYRTHEALRMGTGSPGSMSFFGSMERNEHLSFIKHLTAEVHRVEFVPDKGDVVRFVRRRRQNHWLDALSLSMAAGSFCGFDDLLEELSHDKKTEPAV